MILPAAAFLHLLHGEHHAMCIALMVQMACLYAYQNIIALHKPLEKLFFLYPFFYRVYISRDTTEHQKIHSFGECDFGNVRYLLTVFFLAVALGENNLVSDLSTG